MNMAEGDDAIIQKILGRVGKKVSFHYPDKRRRGGTLKDRVVMPPSPGLTGLTYWDVVDLLEFPVDPMEPEGEKSERIRIGYYLRSPDGKIHWGSQTTITEPVTIWKKLLVQAAREKQWFRELLDDVMRELPEEFEEQASGNR